jgi:predicted unusual protein kinase regulating ubiquinone biosynthesis (AarF/ABC1/UbiB family)
MTLSLSEVLSALPADWEQDDASREALSRLAADLSARPVPLGAFRRFRSLGTLSVKVAFAYLAWWLRAGFAEPEARERGRNEVQLRSALEVLRTMGYLRGVMSKFGQLMANYPTVAPERFADIVGKLHFEAPPMHFSLLREQVRAELGKEPQDLFAEFETTAFAAASLGQVHRARLKDGRRVAVKIQYPSIGRTIRDDFRAFSAIVAPMRLSADWTNLKDQWEHMRRMVEEETDYEREAQWLRTARSAFSDEDEIVVPRVHPEYSTRRVLTMDYLDGRHVRAFMASQPSQDVRNRHGLQIFLATMRLWYRARMIYADPHPGNFLFLPDGRLGLIDFGCCHALTDEEWEFLYESERVSALDAWSGPLRRWYARGIELDEESQVGEDRMKLLQDYTGWLWEPFQGIEPFDFSSEEYLRRGMHLMGEMFRRRYVRSKPVNIWLTRLFFGTRAMAYRLQARVAVRCLLDRETPIRRSAT